MRRSALMILCTLAAFTATQNAEACRYTGHRHRVLNKRIKNIGLTLCRTHFAPGSPAHDAALAVIKELNNVQGSTLRFSIAALDEHREYHKTLKKDGHFRLDFVEPKPTRSGDASFSGRTVTRAGRGGIVEFDIVFNRRIRFNFGLPTAWRLKGKPSFRNIMLHEIGHGLGFKHSAKETHELSIMGGKTGKWIGMKRPGLKAWDHGHIRFHYGKTGFQGQSELVLSNYRTEQKKPGGIWRCALNRGLSKRKVSKGDSLVVDWRLFNTGAKATDKPFEIKLLLSQDERPDNSDLILGRLTVGKSLAASSSVAQQLRVTVPNQAKAGTYHVLVVVDTTGKIAELRERNNFIAIAKTLTIERRPRLLSQ